MKEIQKRPLTHWICVKSYPWWHLMFAMIFIGVPTTTIIVGIISGEIYNLNIFTWVIVISIFIFMLVVGLELSINAFKFLISMTKKQYFVYLAVVSDKRIGIGVDNNGVEYGNGSGTTYYLQFKKNRYKKQVSKKEYELAQIGTPYYLVKIIGANEAFAAFAESKYYLHKSVQKQFTQVDKNEFN